MEVEAIDARERARKERQEARFAARQQLRQQMIDRVRRKRLVVDILTRRAHGMTETLDV